MKKVLSILLLMNSVGFSFAMDSNVVRIDADFPLREQVLRRAYQLENLERRPMRNNGMFHINEKNEILHDTTGFYTSQKQIDNLENVEDLERRPTRAIGGGGMFHFDEKGVTLHDTTGLYASQKQVENLENLEEDLERRPVRNGGGMFHFDERDIQLYDSTDGLDFVANKQ